MLLLRDLLRYSPFFSPNLLFIFSLSHSLSFYFYFFRHQGSSIGRWLRRVVLSLIGLQWSLAAFIWGKIGPPFSDAFSFPSDPWHHLKGNSSLIRVASHIVQGLNSPLKRRKYFQNSSSQPIEVLLLQETNFHKSYNSSFIHTKFPQFFLAKAEDKTKGVGIFSKTVTFSPKEEIRDPEGRYVLLSGSVNGTLYTFILYYAPNHGQARFFLALCQMPSPLISWIQ